MRQAVQMLHTLGHQRLAYIGNLIPLTSVLLQFFLSNFCTVFPQ